MNENAKRLLTLEAENEVVHAENKDQLTKVESLTTSATPPPGFGHARYKINANPSSAHGQTTPRDVDFNTHHLIFQLRASAGNPAIPECDQAPEPVMLDPIAPMPMTSTAQKLGSLHLQGTQKTGFIAPQLTQKLVQRTQFSGFVDRKMGSFVGNEPSVSGFVKDHGFVDVQRTQIWDR
ncbi:hypothetical protein ACOSQ3_024666 [Xanthoceras sorbifolium]